MRKEVKMAKDLVCGMDVAEKKAIKTEHKGETYYFCSLGCEQSFKNNPEKFIKK